MAPGARAITSVALALLLAHVLILGLLGAGGAGPAFSDGLQLSSVLLAIYSCFASARRHAGFTREFFTLVGRGFTLWGLGQFTLIYYVHLRHQLNPSPSLSDVFFFAYFIPLAAALVLREEPQKRGVNWILTLDFAQVGILIVAVYLNFLLYLPSLASSQLEVLRSVANVYSVFDVLLAGGFLLRYFLSAPGAVRRLYGRFTVVLWIYALGSAMWGFGTTAGKAPQAGSWFDLGYSLPFLLAAVSMATWKADEEAPSVLLRRRDALVQALPTLGPIAVLLLAMHVLSISLPTAITIIVASFVCYYARLWLTQAALRSSEAQFRALAESSLASILIYQDNRFAYANPAAQAISGYSQEEMLTMNPGALLPPEFLEKVAKRVAARRRAERTPGAEVSPQGRQGALDGHHRRHHPVQRPLRRPQHWIRHHRAQVGGGGAAGFGREIRHRLPLRSRLHDHQHPARGALRGGQRPLPADLRLHPGGVGGTQHLGVECLGRAPGPGGAAGTAAASRPGPGLGGPLAHQVR